MAVLPSFAVCPFLNLPIGTDSTGRTSVVRPLSLLTQPLYMLQRMGALVVDKVIEDHQIWRLVTCMWLHAGVFHVLANMLSLLFVGIRLEQEFGFVRIGLLYVISGIGGSLLSTLFIRNTISVGASGALFGLLGGMLSELLTNWTIYTNKFAALLSLVLIIAINLAVGILPHVDNFAHIGGFISGFFLGFVFLMRPQYAWVRERSSPLNYFGTAPKSKYKVYQYVLLFLSLIILICGFAIGLILLLRGIDMNKYCSWCHYLKCFDTSLWKCQPEQQGCETRTIGNQVMMKCLSNGKSSIYMLDGHNSSPSLEELCFELCS